MIVKLAWRSSAVLVCAIAAVSLGAAGCDDRRTSAVVLNAYQPGAGATYVAKLWWVTTLFPGPTAPGDLSATERTIPASDFAYALLAPDWSPNSGLPSRLIAVKSTQKLTARVHELMTIIVSDQEFSGNCATGSTLADDDARLVTERIFPEEFAGATYDPATCVATGRSASDASDGGIHFDGGSRDADGN